MAASGIQECGPVLARKWQTEYGFASTKPKTDQIVLLPGIQTVFGDEKAMSTAGQDQLGSGEHEKHTINKYKESWCGNSKF